MTHTHRTRLFATAALAGAALVGTSATAAHLTYYTADLNQLNDSNVTGNAVLIHDTDAMTLDVTVSAFNLEPEMNHVMHIHGRFDGSGDPADSVAPDLSDDADGDGLIEVLEGVPKYGDILLPLGDPLAAGGVLNFHQTFDLTDDSQFMSPVTGTSYSAEDIFPLNLREIVIHGKTVATGVGAGTDGEADGTGGYKAVLPVAAGDIVGSPVPVPEPASLALLGLGGLMMASRRRKA